LKRNSRSTRVWRGGYDPARAQQLAKHAVSVEHWVTLALEYGCIVFSHAAIYRFIYHRVASAFPASADQSQQTPGP